MNTTHLNRYNVTIATPGMTGAYGTIRVLAANREQAAQRAITEYENLEMPFKGAGPYEARKVRKLAA